MVAMVASASRASNSRRQCSSQSATKSGVAICAPGYKKEDDSDAGVPRITAFRRCRAQTFAEVFERVGDRQAGYILHALVAQLPGYAHAKRTAKRHWKIAIVHSPGQKCLGMQGVGHIHAFPPVLVDREIDDVARLRQG